MEGRAMREFPPAGTLITAVTEALTVCEWPGCPAGVARIVLHTVRAPAPSGRLDFFQHQLCDAHARENIEGMRSLGYEVRPVSTIWRDGGVA